MFPIVITKEYDPGTTRSVLKNIQSLSGDINNINVTYRAVQQSALSAQAQVAYQLLLIRKMLFELSEQGFSFEDNDLVNELNQYNP